MSVETQAEALTQRALIVLEGASSEGPGPVARDIANFLSAYRAQLPQWRIDDLEGAYARLTGNATGAPEPERSAFMSGLKTWVSDDSSASVYWGEQAKETLSNIGAKIGDAIGAGADSAAGKMLKSPTIIAAGIVIAVLGAAWVWRSFK